MYLKVATSIFVLLGEVVGLVPSHAPIKGCLSCYVVGELGRGPMQGCPPTRMGVSSSTVVVASCCIAVCMV